MPGASSSSPVRSIRIRKREADVNDDLTVEPDTQPYFALTARNRFDIDLQRNILLNFVDGMCLNEEFMKFLDSHFPPEEYPDEEDE